MSLAQQVFPAQPDHLSLHSGPFTTASSIQSIHTSAAATWSVVDAKELPPAELPFWVDVRDIAALHVLATTVEAAKGERFLCIAGAQFSFVCSGLTEAKL